MCASFSVASSTGSYQITLEAGISDRTLSGLDEAQLLADEFFQPMFTAFSTSPIFIHAAESEKSLDRVPALIQHLRAAGANRRTRLVAMGGGTIQDLSAFVASIYMRGVAWSYMPTTVLAMVDSCIGGKSSINVGPFKNLVGTFYPPEQIFIDPLLAGSLSAVDFSSGLIEAAKICFCRGSESFLRYLSHRPETGMAGDALEHVILESLLAKKYFIEIDEFDRKERLLLNLGHTFGHAIEGASNYGIPHGIAVGLGILCSLTLQKQRGIHFDSAPDVARLEEHLRTLMSAYAKLPALLKTLDLAQVVERFESDKKHTRDAFVLILIAQTGQVVLERLPRTNESLGDLRQAITQAIESYTS
jgi:3-dehydroquinate synthase